MIDLVRRMYEPFLLAFSTASSEASYPKILEQLERFGVSKKIASFVLPLGYSFNLDGTMAYCTFATMFIAQAYGVDMPLGKQLAMAAVLMLTSKGVAGVPRASLVVILATLKQFGIPEAGLLLILGIDQFLDMGRSATNVIGNSLAASAVAKFENELGPAKDEVRRGRGRAAAARPPDASGEAPDDLATAASPRRRDRDDHRARRSRAGLQAPARSAEDHERRRSHRAAAGERGEHARRPHRDAQEGARQRRRHHRLSRGVVPVLVRAAGRGAAARLFDRSLPRRRRRDRARAQRRRRSASPMRR